MTRILAILVLISLVPASAGAQEIVELSDSQRAYNEKGVAAIRDENYPLAISSFESSLTIGEANVTFLNLGRAYQRAGQCMQAKTAYAKVTDAAPVAAPSREEILAVLAKYSGELPEQCPATLKMTCPSGTTVSVDDEPEQDCNEEMVVSVPPGKHFVRAPSKIGPDYQREVDLQEGEEVSLHVQFEEERLPYGLPRKAPDMPKPAPAKPKREPLRTAGIIVGSVGAAGLTAGLILDYAYVKGQVGGCAASEGGPCDKTQREAAVTARTINRVVFATGAGLTVAGAILYFVGGSSDSGVSLQYDGGPGIAYTTRF